MFKMIWEWITSWVHTQQEVSQVIEEMDPHTKVEECGDCPPIDSMKKAELLMYAAKHGIVVNKSDTKAVILEKIRNN